MKKAWILFLPSLLLAAPSVSEKNLLERAHTAYIHDHFEDALPLYRQAASDGGASPEALKGILRSALWTSGYAEAASAGARLSVSYLHHPPTSNWLAKQWQLFTKAAVREKAVDFTEKGKWAEAIELYRQLLALEPQNRGLLRDIEWVFWRAQHYEEAAEIAMQSAALRSSDVEAWNNLGKTLIAAHEPEEALRAYRKSLILDAKQPLVEQAIGKLYVDLRDFQTALRFLGNIQKLRPEADGTYPNLAKAQFYQGQYAASAQTWAQAVERFPDNVDYKIYEAQALYFSGHVSEALARLKKISAATGNRQATDFLTDDAIATGQLAKAETLMSEAPGDPLPEDPQLLKMATLYKDMGQSKQSIAMLDKNLQTSPHNITAILFKADYALQQGDDRQARKGYKQAQQMDPSAIRAWSGMAEARFAGGWPLGAIFSVHRAEKMDPTDPYLILQEARYIYENGNASASARLMHDWREQNPEVYVPVLLYHGLTPFSRDPMLAYPMHITTDRFQEHMRAIHEAGYTPISAEDVTAWMAGARELPPQPILITFDDARADSFRYADPILEKYGLKASMFVAIVNVEEHVAPAYAPWRQIEQMARSGRWEIESHGDLAHMRIPIDSRGRQGYFLINRQWLEAEKRFETLAEWKARIQEDYENSRRKIQEHIGRTPSAYAFPAGTYGQLDTVNSPEAVEMNLAAVRRYFKTSYHQDTYGINVRSRDPARLTRQEAHKDWTGEQLVRHIRTQNPFALIARQMTRQSTWEGHPYAARHWLGEMRRLGAPDPVLQAEEARIAATEGHFTAARSFAAQAVQANDPDPDIPKVAELIERLRHPEWTPGIEIMEDNRSRTNVVFHQEGTWQQGDSLWNLLHRTGSFHEQTTLVDNAFGAGWAHPLGNDHFISLHAMRHFLTAGGGQEWTGAAGWRAIWAGDVNTDLDLSRDLVETQPAMSEGITARTARAQVQSTGGLNWRGKAQAQWSELSDDNDRQTLDGEAERRLSSWLNLWGVYHFHFDNAREVRPEYYSPQTGVENQLGLHYGQRAGRWVLDAKYLPGIGSEKGTGALFIQDLETSLGFKWKGDSLLRFSYAHSSTPTYQRNTFDLEMTYRFGPL